MNIRTLVFSCLVLFAPLPGSAANAASVDVEIHELGRAWLAANDGIGLSIGVYDNGQRRFYNFGATQLDGNKPPTKDTIYEIGSIGKTMTGQLLARAIVEARAGLNDEVWHYLDEPYPNLENGGEKVRLVHLANMTSQLTDNIPDVTQIRLVPGEALAVTRQRVLQKYTRAEFMRQLHRVMPRNKPGTDPSYSNVASMVLGLALEKLYGEPFASILASEIEKPLRMGSGTDPVIKLLAKGYTKDNEELPTFDAPTQYAASSLRYSTADLLRYASWQLVEHDASVKLAHQATWSTPDKRHGVAFYWIIGESPQGRRLNYSGGTYGFSSLCDLYPDAQLGIVTLSNKASDGAQDSLRALSARIADVLRPAGPLSPLPSSEVAPPPGR